MDEIEKFQQDVADNIKHLKDDRDLRAVSRMWIRDTNPHKYTYNFAWLGRPIIQLPQDIVAIQEIIWKVKPDVIVETGIAHGGSLMLSASVLRLLGGDRKVIGIDIEIRPHNRKEIESHPLASMITMVEGSSIAPATIEKVRTLVGKADRPLVILDSNHTHDHVLGELRAYAPLVKAGSYVIVLDTIIEAMPPELYPNRPWRKGNSPKSAVWQYMKEMPGRFAIDDDMDAKLQISVAPDGYLRCVKD